MRILVSGANGYLGRGIVDKLLASEAEVIAADFKLDDVNAFADRKCCDLFSIERPYDYFGEPDVLLHLAWRDGFVHYSENHICDLPKHYNFINAMAESGVKKIVGMGSVHEIGFFEGSVKEDTPCNPVTPYGISKNALRELTSMICNQKKIGYQWLRGFYIVGNTSYGSSIFSKIVEAERKGEHKFPFTMGLNQFDFIDYDDFCTQVAYAVMQDDINGVINICTGRPEKLSERVERFIKDNNYNIMLEYGAFPDRPYDSKAIWGDDGKIGEILRRHKECKEGRR